MKHIARPLSLLLALSIVVGMLPGKIPVQASEVTKTAEETQIPQESITIQDAKLPERAELPTEAAKKPFEDTTPEKVFTAQSDESTTSYLYTLDDNNNATITGYSGSDTTLNIPDTIGGYPVVAIGASAFRNCTALQAVEIPGSVTTIGSYAFSSCTGLQTVRIADGCSTIGSYAFSGCSNLSSISVPGTVTNVGGYAFKGCNELTTVGPIGSGCAYEFGWETTIPAEAFSYLEGLTQAAIPEGITAIGVSAFYLCTSLETVSLPESLVSIGASAFRNCTALTSVTLPDSITQLESNAFSGCTSLQAVEIPGSVTTIGSYAFSNCTGLQTVRIADGCTTIGSYAFSGCSNLAIVCLPDSIININSYAFRNCNGLTDIYYCGGPDEWKTVSIGNNDLLSDATIHYYSTGPALEQFYEAKNNTSVVDFGEHQLQLSGVLNGTDPYRLTLKLTNKSEKWQLFMSQAEKDACMLNNVKLVIDLPDGIMISDYESNRHTFQIDRIPLGNTLTFDIGLTVDNLSTDPVKLAVYADGKIMIRQALPIVWPPEATDTVLPDGNVNSNMANRFGSIELSSGDYGETLKVTAGQNVSVKSHVSLTVDELIVEGDLNISGDVTAKKVKVKKDGSLHVGGTLTVEKELILDNDFPRIELYGTLNAAKVEVSQGLFAQNNGTAEIDTLIINYGGHLKQTGGNLIVKIKMEVSSSYTSTLTGGILWLGGDFKQSWHSGNFQASGSHSTVRQNKWGGSETKFYRKDAYFNNLYVDEAIAGLTVSTDMYEFAQKHIKGEFCSASLDLSQRTYTVLDSLDPQHTWETGLLKAYDTKVDIALNNATLSSLLGQERYEFVLQAVADWYATTTSPLIENEFTDSTYQLEYMQLDMGEDVIIIYTAGTQYGEFGYFGQVRWYGRIGNQVYTRENSQNLGITTMRSIDAFKRQLAVYLATSAVEQYINMLGKGIASDSNKAISRLVKIAMECDDLSKKIKKKVDKFEVECQRIKDELELPVISEGRTLNTDMELQTQTIASNPVLQISFVDVPAMAVMSDTATGDDSTEETIPEDDPLLKPITFTDEGLAMLLRTALGRTPEYAITYADAREITKLNLSNYTIYSLDGLEAFSNLTSLNLSGNNFYDLSPLSGLLQLEELNISANRIEDLSPLSGLSNLTTLSVADNPLKDISALKNLSQLTMLDLQNCNITDFSALQSLSDLEELNISGISMPDGDLNVISAQQSLASLIADHCDLVSLDGLNGSALEVLSAQYNQLTTLGTLDTCSLKTVMLEGNQLTDISALEDSVLLTSMKLGGNNLDDESLAALAGAINLQQLDLKSNQIYTLAFMANLTALERLDVSSNNLEDLSGVAGHTALAILCLDDCTLTDEQAAQLTDMAALQQLQMRCNGLTSAAFLTEFTALVNADLSDNDIEPDTVPEGLDAIVNITIPPVEAKVLELETTDDKLAVGESMIISCYVYPAAATDTNLSWSSSDTSIATVSEWGEVHAVSPGAVTITAVSANGKMASIQIDVSDSNVIAEGQSGDVVWYLSNEGILTFSGTGNMDDYATADNVPWYDYRDDIKAVRFEDGVSSIGNAAFAHCSNLTSVEIPDSMVRIGWMAFSGSAITSVYLPLNATDVDPTAFGALWEGRGDWACGTCDQLNEIVVDPDNPTYTSDEHGVLFNKDMTELIRCPGGFSGAYTIPESVVTLGDGAFNWCGNLTEVTLRENITSIGMDVFNGCISLEKAVLPRGLTMVPAAVFANCASLTEVVIPASVETIEAYAFYECTSLERVIFCGTSEQWAALDYDMSNTSLSDEIVQYHHYENAVCIYCGASDSSGVILNASTDVTYATLEAAVATASEGQTLKLQADWSEEKVMVTPGITLDLNGFTLTASYLAAFDSAHVIDSMGTGRLVIGENKLVLDDSNTMVPVYNGSAYVFTKAGFAVRQDSSYTGEGIKINAMAYPVNMDVVELLKDGSADNDVQIIIRLSWDTADGTGSQEFAFTDQVVSSVYSSNQGVWNGYNKMFSMVITGFANIINLKANIVAVSGTGVEYISSTSLSVT